MWQWKHFLMKRTSTRASISKMLRIFINLVNENEEGTIYYDHDISNPSFYLLSKGFVSPLNLIVINGNNYSLRLDGINIS